LLLGTAGSGAQASSGTGLFTSLPIIWPEADDVSSLISAKAGKHWLLAALEKQGPVVPLDRFNQRDGKLAGLNLIVMAQPRPLAAEENVTLDRWVRDGGRLLLFADPMLTQHSAFALGDKRRPQGIVMLGPLLRHWGLVLHFDPDQMSGERAVPGFGLGIPVNLPGKFTRTSRRGPCHLQARGIAAECRIGKGRALILADAALLEAQEGFEPQEGDSNGRAAVLATLLTRLEGRRSGPVEPGKTRSGE
jgi:hypothetical protein